MPSIKESINDVYQEKRFTANMRQQVMDHTLTPEVPNKSLHWQPAFASVAVVLLLLFFVLTTSQVETIETAETSMDRAPFEAQQALVERFSQFQQITADGTITEAERRQYISTSDWDLQLAFETGNSIFYHRNEMKPAQIEAVTGLLYNMYYFVYEKIDMDMLSPLPSDNSMEEIIAYAYESAKPFKQSLGSSYVSSLNEKPLTKNKFLNLEGWQQALFLSFIALFVYLFVQNIRIDRKKLAGALQLLFIVLLCSFFFMQDKTFYSYNETALLEAAEQQLKQMSPNDEIVEIIAIAQFKDGRVGLFQLQNDKLMTIDFMNHASEHHFSGASITYDSAASHSFVMSDFDELQEVFAVNDPNIAAFALVDTFTNKSYRIDTQEDKKLYLHSRSTDVNSAYIQFYNKEGKAIE